MIFRRRRQPLFGADAKPLNLQPVAPSDATRRLRVGLWVLGAGLVLVAGSITFVASRFARQEAADASRLGGVSLIQSGLFQYFLQHNAYPAGTDLVLGEGASCSNRPCQVLGADGFTASAGAAVYLAPVPADASSTSFVYTQGTDGVSFSLRFQLKRGSAGFPAGQYVLTPAGFSLVGH